MINPLETNNFDKVSRIIEVDDEWQMISGLELMMFEPPSYLIYPLIIKDTVTGIYGATGVYKSFFALAACLSLATGMEGPESAVCYVAAEGEKGTKVRIAAWLHHHNKKELGDNFVLIPKPVALTDNVAVSRYIRKIKQRELEKGKHFVLHVFDTLSQCTSGAEENASKEMSVATSNMIRIRRELNTTVVYIHHSGKDASKEMRGSNAIKANTDAMIEITSTSDNQGEATLKRQKDGPGGAKMYFSTVDVQLPHLIGSKLTGSLVCIIR